MVGVCVCYAATKWTICGLLHLSGTRGLIACTWQSANQKPGMVDRDMQQGGAVRYGDSGW